MDQKNKALKLEEVKVELSLAEEPNKQSLKNILHKCDLILDKIRHRK